MKCFSKAAFALTALAGAVIAGEEPAQPQVFLDANGQEVITHQPVGSLNAAAALTSNTKVVHQPTEILFKLKATPTQPSAGASTAAARFKTNGNPQERASSVAQSHGLSLIKKIGESRAAGGASAARTGGSAPQGANAQASSGRPEIYKAKVHSGQDTKAIIDALNRDPDVEWAEVNGTFELYVTTPNDSEYQEVAISMEKTGVNQIWDQQQGSEDVVIAVIDTGVDYSHPDLVNNIWINPGEVPNDGIDNDGNGYVDDVRGWDFVSAPAESVHEDDDPAPADNDPMDVQGHGTHVSGIAAAEGNNGIGIAGVSWNSKIMALRAGYKTLNGNGSLQWSDTADALVYACDNGADIINMSFGSIQPSHTMAASIEYCAAKGALLVAATGNDGHDLPHYPAAYNQVLAVAAKARGQYKLADFSNYGVWADIAAPGSNLHSTLAGGGYGKMSGTSMASPFAAGMAALIKSETPELTAAEIRDLMRNMAQWLVHFGAVSPVGGGYAWLEWPLDKSVMKPKAVVVSLFSEDDTLHEDRSFNPGEQITLRPTVKNFGTEDENVRIELTTTDPYLQIIDGIVDIDNVAPNRAKGNWNDTFEIRVLENAPQNHKALIQVKTNYGNNNRTNKNDYLSLNKTFKSFNYGSPISNVAGYVKSQFIEHGDGRISHFYRSQMEGKSTLYHRIRELDGRWSSVVKVPVVEDIGVSEFSVTIDANDELHVAFSTIRSVQYAHYDGVWSSTIVSTDLLRPNGTPRILVNNDADKVIAWVTKEQLETTVSYALKLAYFDQNGWSAVEHLVSNPETAILDMNMLRDDLGDIQLFWDQQAVTSPVSVNRTDAGTLVQAVWHKDQQNFTPFEVKPIRALKAVVKDSNQRVHLCYTDIDFVDIHQVSDAVGWGEENPLQRCGVVVANNEGGVDAFYFYNDVKQSTYVDGSWSPPRAIHELTYREGFTPDSFGSVLITKSGETLLSTSVQHSLFAYSINIYSTLANEVTVPAKVLPVDEGSQTSSKNISAFADASIVDDLETFEFAIGSAPGSADLVSWTAVPAGQTTLTTPDYLQRSDLRSGQDYFVSTRSLNASGYPSAVASSDGITYISVTPNISMTSPANGAVLTSASQTFLWEKVNGATGYLLQVGTTGRGSSELADVFVGDVDTTSYTVHGLPTDGSTLYVSLQVLNGDAQTPTAHYTYQAYSIPKPEILSPQNGATFNSDSVVFSWKAIPESSGYSIRVGSSLGADDIANRFASVDTTSMTINGLPTDGRTVYVQISSFPNGVLTQRNYTYTAYQELAAPSLEVTFQSSWFLSTTTLSWQGAEAVDVYRNSVLYSSNVTQNPLSIQRWFNSTRYDWKVCHPNTNVCSQTQR